MTVHLGNDWFQRFAQDDAREKVSNRITKAGQTSVRDLDLQALLKFLRYRASLSDRVLTYFGFYENTDQFAADTQRQQFCSLLDRLINDFRNRIEAHCRAADIEKELSGQELNRIYGYQEAVQDMCKLAQVFEKSTDANGVSYYRQICQLTAPKKKKWVLPVLLTATLVIAVLAISFLWQNGIADDIGNTYYNEKEPFYVGNSVTVWPVCVYYDNNDIVAECYVINGTDKTVYNVDIYSYKLMLPDKMLAAANFGELQNTKIEPKEYIEWTFRFPKDTVFVQNGDLTEIKTEVLSRYE